MISNRRAIRGLTRLEVAALIVGILALNVAGALVYKYKFAASKGGAAATEVGAAAKPSEADQVEFRTRRAAGLSALEAGQYDVAVTQFTAALRVGHADSDIMQLLRMAKEFQDKERATTTAAAAAAEPPPEVVEEEPQSPPVAVVPKAVAPKAPVRVVTRQPQRPPARPVERPVVLAAAEPPTPQPATLLITSTPAGLLIELDGARKDLTPAKVSIAAGTHSVGFWRGDRRLMLRTVILQPGQVQSVDFEEERVPVQAAATVAPAPAPVVLAPPPAAVTEPPKSVAAVTPTPALPKVEEREEAGVRPAPTVTGELLIQSLNVYGEIFVGGKSFGYPPVVAKDLAPGSTTVEVRVDGTVRRTRQVDIIASRRTTVRIP